MTYPFSTHPFSRFMVGFVPKVYALCVNVSFFFFSFYDHSRPVRRGPGMPSHKAVTRQDFDATSMAIRRDCAKDADGATRSPPFSACSSSL
jgi:hypothetical protein